MPGEAGEDTVDEGHQGFVSRITVFDVHTRRFTDHEDVPQYPETGIHIDIWGNQDGVDTVIREDLLDVVERRSCEELEIESWV